MKTFYYVIAVVLCLMAGQSVAIAAKGRMDVPVKKEKEEEKERPELNPKGPRMPSAPMFCTVDFSNCCIVSSIPDEILYYELLDEYGDMCIVTYESDCAMVTYLSEQSGCYQLRLVTAECSYIGYLEL